MSHEKSSSREIRFCVFIRAAPAEVWKALVDPGELAQWSYMKKVELDRLDLGGRYRFLDPPEPEDGAEILELAPSRRFAYRWHSSEPAPTVVTYDLDEQGEYTRLRVRNGPYPEGEAWDDLYARNFAGWVELHLKLRRHVETAASPA